ncbi:hypothetical protein D9M71_517980 [compost metagenome]
MQRRSVEKIDITARCHNQHRANAGRRPQRYQRPNVIKLNNRPVHYPHLGGGKRVNNTGPENKQHHQAKPACHIENKRHALAQNVAGRAVYLLNHRKHKAQYSKNGGKQCAQRKQMRGVLREAPRHNIHASQNHDGGGNFYSATELQRGPVREAVELLVVLADYRHIPVPGDGSSGPYK